jgi:uncharacterized protein
MTAHKKSKCTVDIPIHQDGNTFMGLYHTMTGAFYLICEKDWNDVLYHHDVSSDTNFLNTLYEQGILVRENVDERWLFETWKNQHAYDFGILKSKVLVTRKCNNRCLYCIIHPEAKDMSSETAKIMDEFYTNLIKEKRPLQVKDDFLGGEPLLNIGVILEIAQRRFFFCRGKGIDYGFTVTTNGLLITPSTISDMKTVGLTGVRISLAGPSSVHDVLRPSQTCHKSYDRIMQNLENVSDLISLRIECQYDSGALDFLSMPEMLHDLKRRGIPLDDISFSPILSRRGENPFNSGHGDPRIFLYLKQEAAKHGYPVNDQPPSNACMADFKSSIVFDTDGSIIPCPSLQGSEMAYGHVNTGIDFVGESNLLKRNLPDRCLDECELLPICMGGCRLQALVHHQNFNGIDCHYDSYRLFLEDYIREKALAALSF